MSLRVIEYPYVQKTSHTWLSLEHLVRILVLPMWLSLVCQATSSSQVSSYHCNIIQTDFVDGEIPVLTLISKINDNIWLGNKTHGFTVCSYVSFWYSKTGCWWACIPCWQSQRQFESISRYRRHGVQKEQTATAQRSNHLRRARCVQVRD